jgi:hypothetical protein
LETSWQGANLLTKEGVKQELTRLETEGKKGVWWGHWLEKYSQQVESLDGVFHILGEWLAERGSLDALKIAAECVAEKGTRDTLDILHATGATQGAEADAVRENSRFAVCRRTLS